MAALRWCDSDYRLQPGVWMGMTLTAGDEPRPAFTVQVCDPLRVRIAVGDEPVLWTRIDDDYWGYEILRAMRHQSLCVLPPIPFSLVHEHSALTSRASDRAWAKTFVEMLSALERDLVSKIVSQRSHGYVQWDFGDEVYPITLRQLSMPDSGRVKAWRKQARAGTLAPVLLSWVSGLAAYVVLDGPARRSVIRRRRLLCSNSSRSSWPPPSVSARDRLLNVSLE
jgi:hypothetical protein